MWVTRSPSRLASSASTCSARPGGEGGRGAGVRQWRGAGPRDDAEALAARGVEGLRAAPGDVSEPDERPRAGEEIARGSRSAHAAAAAARMARRGCGALCGDVGRSAGHAISTAGGCRMGAARDCALAAARLRPMGRRIAGRGGIYRRNRPESRALYDALRAGGRGGLAAGSALLGAGLCLRGGAGGDRGRLLRVGLDELVAFTVPANRASRGLLARLGVSWNAAGEF